MNIEQLEIYFIAFILVMLCGYLWSCIRSRRNNFDVIERLNSNPEPQAYKRLIMESRGNKYYER